MNKASVIGIVLALIAVFVGMVLKGASLSSLANPAALLIIILGTIATLFIGFEMEEIKKIPKLFKIAFTSKTLPSKHVLVDQFMELGTLSRREGLLALESQMEKMEDPFMKLGLQMVLDGSDQEFVQDVLMEEVNALEERHRNGALIFTQAGTYAPTLGVLGAVVGLIAALSNLNEVEKLGHLISAAFVATLLGIFTGYVLWHPIANKLKQISKKEVEIRLMMIEGILSVQAGISVAIIKQKLSVFIPPAERGRGEEKEKDDE